MQPVSSDLELGVQNVHLHCPRTQNHFEFQGFCLRWWAPGAVMDGLFCPPGAWPWHSLVLIVLEHTGQTQYLSLMKLRVSWNCKFHFPAEHMPCPSLIWLWEHPILLQRVLWNSLEARKAQGSCFLRMKKKIYHVLCILFWKSCPYHVSSLPCLPFTTLTQTPPFPASSATSF